jgi:hypothetical protein
MVGCDSSGVVGTAVFRSNRAFALFPAFRASGGGIVSRDFGDRRWRGKTPLVLGQSGGDDDLMGEESSGCW